ncbi:PKD domain-containing protein [Candidatus Woesearchaeota archaeon]|nr:PKD domain-containing protein [Candidatus Woesearchaeota archaeon]
MKKLLLSMFFLFVLTLSLASAITVSMVWDDNGVYGTDPINLEQGETAQYIVDAYTTAGPNAGYDHLIGVDLYVLEADDLTQIVQVISQETHLYSLGYANTLDTSSLPVGDYTLAAIATDYDDTYPNGGNRQDTAILNFSVLMPTYAPVMQEVVINPANPTIADNLTGTCIATDADSTNVMYEYQWVQVIPISAVETTSYYPQNTVVPVNGIDSSQTSLNQVWELRCRAFDGALYSSWMSTSVTIADLPPQNNAPVTLFSFILPNTPGDDDMLSGYCSAFDADADAVAFNWAWYQNGAVVSQGISNYFTDLSGPIQVSNYSETFTNVGDDFIFACQAYDGQDAGAWLNSSNVTISGGSTGNVAPVNLTVSVPSQLNSTQDLLGTCVADDADGDLLYYNARWYLNGAFFSGTSSIPLAPGVAFSASMPASYTSVGDVWTLSCDVTDGQVTVGPVSGSTLIVDGTGNNNAPVNLTVSVPPQVNDAQNVIATCVADDVDGDLLHYGVEWYQNGVYLIGSSSGWIASGVDFTATLSSAFTSVGDNITISCEVTDGQDIVGPVNASTSIVSNGGCLTNPVAIIAGPTTVDANTLASFDASGSVASNCGTIVSYDWNVTCGLQSVVFSGVTFNYTFATLGDCSVELTVTDDSNLTASDVLNVTVVNPFAQGPTAIIKAPQFVNKGEEFVVHGFDSIAPAGEEIVSYQWVVTNSLGVVVATYSGKMQYPLFDVADQYTFTLTVEDTSGDLDSASKIVTVKEPEAADEDDTFKIKDKLQVSSIHLEGSAFEQVSPDGLLYVSVVVKNNFDERVDDVQVTFLLPELGRFKSSTSSISSGDSKRFTVLVDIPYDFEEGYYYPEIIVDADQVDKRVKISYFEVVN